MSRKKLTVHQPETWRYCYNLYSGMLEIGNSCLHSNQTLSSSRVCWHFLCYQPERCYMSATTYTIFIDDVISYFPAQYSHSFFFPPPITHSHYSHHFHQILTRRIQWLLGFGYKIVITWLLGIYWNKMP